MKMLTTLVKMGGGGGEQFILDYIGFLSPKNDFYIASTYQTWD